MVNEAPRITDPKALRALAHPLRWQLMEIVDREDSVTATRCAQETGESVANCSYHLNTLAKYGFVEQAAGGQGREKPWQRGRQKFSVDSLDLDADGKVAAQAAAGAFLDFELNQIKERQLTVHLDPPEWQAAVGQDKSKVYLTPDELEELRRGMRELLDEFLDRRDKPELRPEGARQVNIFVSASIPPPRD
jgi:hypothetical protein